jgi:glycosyltransferase involved in cell wall biosynthesis
MKIAYVYDTIYPYTFGGVEKRIWELSIRLVKKGHEVHIFGPKLWKGERTFKREGVYLHGVCSPPKKRFVKGRRSVVWPIYFALKVLPALLKERFDIIDCQNFPYFPCFSARIASGVRGSSLVITWHEVWGEYWYEYLGRKGIFGKIFEKLASSIGGEMVAVSHKTKRDLERLGVKSQIKVIPNGIDWKKIRDADRSSQSFDILFVGRLAKEKHVDVLLKSIRHIKERIPNVRCAIIGEGPEKEHIEKLIWNLNLHDNISVLGRIDEEVQVFSYMKSSRVFVSASTREGFGIVALEANACGLPVVTIRHPGNAICDLIVDGVNGYTCEFTEQDIAEKVLLAMNNVDDLRAKCKQFAQRYNMDKIVNMTESFYRDLLIRRKMRRTFGLVLC